MVLFCGGPAMTIRIRALASRHVHTWSDVESVKHFPSGSEYLRAPHWHLRFYGGFRQNIPGSHYSLERVR